MRSVVIALAITFAFVGVLGGSNTASAYACENHPSHCPMPPPAPTVPILPILPIPPTLITITGTATVYRSVVTIEASSRDGQVSGMVTSEDSSAGAVREIVPPGPGHDFYCIGIDRSDASPGERANYYIRDLGDGVRSRDQVFLAAGSAGFGCDSFPVSDIVFTSVGAGDFVITAS